MLSRFFPYAVIVLIVALTSVSLPWIGRVFRNTHIRITAFITNVYYAQERSTQLEILKQQLTGLLNDRVTLAVLQKENQLLRQQLNVEENQQSMPSLLASVIGQGSVLGKETLIIDKGIIDGLKGNEPIVISPNILIGKIGSAFERYAIVSLVFNKDFQLPGTTMSGTKGIIKGEVGHQVMFDEISQASPLTNGDIVVTDNQSPAVRAGIIIGKVEKIISKPTDIFKKAQLTVLFEEHTIDSVFILKPLVTQ